MPLCPTEPGDMIIDPDKDRGIHYADGGIDWGVLCYPDPYLISMINAEWELLEQGPYYDKLGTCLKTTV